MARLIDRLRPGTPNPTRAGLVSMYESWKSGVEDPETSFTSYVNDGYKRNGVVFATILARMMLLSDVTFVNRADASRDITRTGRNLQILRRPWPNGRTSDLVTRMEQDGSLAGNAYIHKPLESDFAQRLRPDWVQIVASPTELTGYIYTVPGSKPVYLTPDEVAHYAPVPDPDKNFVGMSWLQPVAEEILGDTAMTRHKRAFLKNAATPNLLITVEGSLPPDVKTSIKEELALRHEGVDNAYKTLLVEGGASANIIGANLRQLEFAVTQAAGENRIAVAGGVPSIVVGLKEGLQAATYSNYGQAMRRFGDLTGRALWGSMSGSLETIAPPPRGNHLWYDTSDIAALRQDAKDEAEIKAQDASTIQTLIASGFTPDTVLPAVASGDYSGMVHTGLTSVQLQPPDDGTDDGSDTDVETDTDDEGNDDDEA